LRSSRNGGKGLVADRKKLRERESWSGGIEVGTEILIKRIRAMITFKTLSV
jgi:hypothetical protein